MQLLSACPAEAASTRKELLVATRHILATDFRKAFLVHLDELLDEQKLIGAGRTCYETLRPLAYSTLADLVHHVRMELQLPQFVRVVQLYCRNLHDPSLPYSIKIMSAKLLLNLIESIARRNSDTKTQSAQCSYNASARCLDVLIHTFPFSSRYFNEDPWHLCGQVYQPQN